MSLFSRKPKEPPSLHPNEVDILMIGPPRSGKTALLAALQYSALKQQTYSAGLNCTVDFASDEMNKIFDNFNDINVTGRFRPNTTSEYVLYEMHLTLDTIGGTSKKGHSRAATVRIAIPDYPGGALLRGRTGNSESNPNEVAAKAEIERRLPSATGLILCLPEDVDAGRASQLFVNDITGMLTRIKGSINLRFLAFVLTKLDAHFHEKRWLCEKGRFARREVAARTTPEALEARLNEHGVNIVLYNAIRRKAPNVICAAGRTSIFGFTSDGRFNYDPDWEGLLIRPSDSVTDGQVIKPSDSLKNSGTTLYGNGRVNSEWHPYHVLDPFVFSADGRLLEYASLDGEDIPREGDGFVRVFC